MADHEMNEPARSAPTPRCASCGSGNLWADYTSLVSFTFNDGQVVRASQGGVLDGTPDEVTCQECGATHHQQDEELWEAVTSALGALPQRVREALSDGAVTWQR